MMMMVDENCSKWQCHSHSLQFQECVISVDYVCAMRLDGQKPLEDIMFDELRQLMMID